MKIVANNRKARHNYIIEQTLEAGIVLKGAEVKSLREGKCSIDESYISLKRGEAFIYNMHISEFTKTSAFKVDPRRERKLLLHKREIKHLTGAVSRKGFTIIPLKVYFNEQGRAKIEIALCRGRKLYDKRRKLKDKAVKRDIKQQLRKRY